MDKNDNECIRFFRAILRRKELRIIEEKRKGKDRRKSFFNFMLFDRRFLSDRRVA